jgi:hypothetical protein
VAWATLENVTTVTTKTVSVDDLAMAQSTIETFVDRYSSPEDDANLKSLDLVRLNRAVCWQAAWLASNPGVEARNLVSSMLQDGTSAQMATMDAVILSPFAKLAIRRLSFRRRTSVRMVSDFERSFGFLSTDPAGDVDSDHDDDAWTPFGQQQVGRWY